MRWLMMGFSEEDERVRDIGGLGHTIDCVFEANSEAWQSAGRTQYDGIWVRWEDVDHAVRPVVQYRSMRPTTRIIVEIPDDLTPPNAELAQWVGLGIYDIVRPVSDSAVVLTQPATIADVLSWSGFEPVDHGAQAGVGQTGKPTIQFRTIEKTVTQKVALSSRPVLIAVVGVSPGVGTTTTAIQVARTLSGSGHDVALVESSNAPPALSRWEEELPAGITVFTSPAPDPVELVRQREWPYIVVDGGAINTWEQITTWQADLTILAGPGDRHRFPRWEPLVMSISRDYPLAIVAGAVVGGRDGVKVSEGLEDESGLTAFVMAEGKKGDRAMLAMLAPVLADGKSRRRWWRKSYTPALPDLPVAVNDSSKPDSDWKYTPSSPSAVPYAPQPAPTPTVNVQIGRQGRRSGLARLWHGLIDAGILWVVASIISWFLVLATAPGSGIPVHAGHWLIWAQWMTSVNGHLLSLVSRL